MYYGYLPLTELVPEDDYTLRAYTRYLENQGDDYFFKKNIRIGNLAAAKTSDSSSKTSNSDSEIPNSKQEAQKTNPENRNLRSNNRNIKYETQNNDFEVSFFPEGGNLVEGAFCKVAFKALNSDGTSENISGEIIDEAGLTITSVETFHAGMGVFSFIPAPGKKYQLKCRNSSNVEKQFDLPQTSPDAYTLAVVQHNNRFVLEVRKSPQSLDIPCYFLAHYGGMVFHFSSIENINEPIAFLKEELPAGVIQLVLFDKQMNPLSERLVFNKNKASETIVFQTDKEAYETRDKIVSTLMFNDLNDIDEGNFSIAVVDDNDAAVDSSTTILSSLLLSSELKGYIENPAYYLRDDIMSVIALDYLMLTHGWRRYDVPKVAKSNLQYPHIPYQTSQTIVGKVQSPVLSRPVSGSEILITVDGSSGMTSTDENGMFKLQDFEYPDSTAFLIHAISSKGSNAVDLVVDDELFPRLIHAPQSPVIEAPKSQEEAKTDPEQNIFLAKAEQRSRYDEDMRVINLSEIVKTATFIRKDEPRLQRWENLSSDVTIRREDFEKWHPNLVTESLRNVAGVSVSSDGRISIRMGGLPLVLIDGIKMEWELDEFGRLESPYHSPLEQVSIYDVESFDLFLGASAGVFGVQGSNGAISITTTRGIDDINRAMKYREVNNSNSTVFTPLGYQKPVEFYSPDYEKLDAKYLTIPDYRTTIFWKPDLVISEENKEATFDFYTSDFPTTYSVVIEGLTTTGKIIRQVEKIIVE